MIVSSFRLFQNAEVGGYAIGAFNVYNLEGVMAVLAAAEAEASPVMLQLHPSALKFGGRPLIALCLEAAENSLTQVAVHLDHSNSESEIRLALDAGMGSIMADGSHFAYDQNVEFTAKMSRLVHMQGLGVEAELGRLTGSEDGISVPDYEAKLTNPEQAAEFVQETGIDSLAVCIGNVHGHYRSAPVLDFNRLEEVRRRVHIPLVLHGASGLPDEMIRRAIELGVRKFNVNTEVRDAYVQSLKQDLAGSQTPDLISMMTNAVRSMQVVIRAKIRLFGTDQQNSKLS